MNLAIMQPYFLPYIGYFQLIKAADKFVIYDNIKFTKKGWIRRNRFLQNGKAALFTIPLKHDSDFLDVRDRLVCPSFLKTKLSNTIKEAYRKAPFFNEVFPLFEKILMNNEANLFKYICFSIVQVCQTLKIETGIILSSALDIDHSMKSQDKVIAICRNLGASLYINPIGGQELYLAEAFKKQGIELKFIKPALIEYKQFENEFVPWLSIIDVMMFNGLEQTRQLLDRFKLI